MGQHCEELDLGIHLVQLLSSGIVVLVIVVLLQIVDDEIAPLLDSRTVAGVVVEVGELRIGVVKGPLDKVVGQIVAPIVVRTVLKVNDNEIRLIVGCEAGIQRRVICGIQFRARRWRYAVRFLELIKCIPHSFHQITLNSQAH